MKNKRRILIAIAAALLLGAGVLLFFLLFSSDNINPGSTFPEKQAAVHDAKTLKAEIEPVTEYYDAVGTVEPRSQAQIEARISARINEVPVRAGDSVSKGDLLIALDDRQMRSRLSQARQSLKTAISRRQEAGQMVNSAEAAFTEAESGYRRIKNFFQAGAATEQDLEQARSRYLQAKAALGRARDGFSGAKAGVQMSRDMVREAEIGLSYTRIRAPAEGTVLKRLADPGDQAMPGKPLLQLRTAAGLRLEAYVRESLVNKVRPGAIHRVALTALGKTVDAEIEELVPYADPRTRTFLVKAGLPDIAGLYPGMYGKLRIPLQEVAVVMAPRAAVDSVGQLELVRVKTPEGWQRRYIKTGDYYGDKVEVLSGLSGGEILKAKGPENGE